MVAVGIGPNRKMRRLTDAEFRAFIAGVLPIAAESPTRGTLLVADDVPATAEDVAAIAGVTAEAAESAMRKLTELDTLATDEDGARYLPSWPTWNPAPRASDSREAARERKRKQRARDRGQEEQLGRSGTGIRPAPTAEDEWSSGVFAPPAAHPDGRVKRKRAGDAYAATLTAYVERRWPTGNQRQLTECVRRAVRSGARDDASVDVWLDQYANDVRRAA